MLALNWGSQGLPCWLRRYRICLQCRRPGFDPWIGKIPCRRAWQPTPVLLPGESHGQRSLAGYSPWGHKEWDTERLTHRAGKADGRRRDHVHVRLKAALQAAALKAGLGLSLALRWTWAWALGLGGGWECGERTAGPWGGD